jgi:hypothetical protein
MITFIKGIFFDQSNRVAKMLADLASSEISPEMDIKFLEKTIEMLKNLDADIQQLIASGDLEVEVLAANNIIKYNTFYETLLTIELFRYLVIMHYGKPEEYFKKKICRIYNETNCLQKPPIITTISNSENYYWALPSYDIIAVPEGEEKNLLNLPDIYHEMGHLVYNQHEFYLKGKIEDSIHKFYNDEINRVITEQRSLKMATFLGEKKARWLSSWIMEFTCDLMATYLVGPAYAWTNMKLTTLSSGENRIFIDSTSHPCDEARMRAIFYMLRRTGHIAEVMQIEQSWGDFLDVTGNLPPPNYDYIFPQQLIEELANNVIAGCRLIDLRNYKDQVSKYGNPISKMLNDAWQELFANPDSFKKWEDERIKEIGVENS